MQPTGYSARRIQSWVQTGTEAFSQAKQYAGETGFRCFFVLFWLFLVFARPFSGIAAFSLVEGLVFWSFILPWATFICIFGAYVSKNFIVRSNEPNLINAVFGAIIASLLITFPAVLLAKIISDVQLASILKIHFYALLTSVSASLLAYLVWIAPATRDIKLASDVQPKMPEFLHKVPAEQRGDIKYLSVQDHYVGVHTVKGEALVLLRFKDAVEQMGVDVGTQVHRSYWVAKKYVKGLHKEKKRTYVVMDDDTRIPVSASYQDLVNELV